MHTRVKYEYHFGRSVRRWNRDIKKHREESPNRMSCPRLVSNFCTPKVIWSQSDLTVIIRVILIDVADYYLRVEDNYLYFSTVTNGKSYYLILQLFGAVIAEKTLHKNVGREIKIYLTKGLKWFQWLRLIVSKEKDPLIAYDLDSISEKEYVKKNLLVCGTVEEIKCRYNKTYIRPPIDEESDSDDYDEDLDLLGYA
ncbi:putative ATP-dependent RNA helicase TDRD12 isoform X2 [Harpegnathos saltator]|uniref:putative ATP-dependent RNA helicase TDRD12 isoform X2 n=1 Tax=Harpegnathos saltator TaxID=610380 RepID=UPI00058E3A87|nr:putative ATP-dependent RNA helicase TDRD12 isoform X2 [Harpegnathos saltator]